MCHPNPPARAASFPVPDPPPPDDSLPPDAAQAVAGLLKDGAVVAHHSCFARLFGGAACGLLLSQFWFWTGTPTVAGRAGGWFWKSQREITEETGLTRAETETARRRLRALGVLEEERRGIPATLHFRLDRATVARRVWEERHAPAGGDPANKSAGIAQTCLPEMRTLVRGKPANKPARTARTTSEKTSETTSETSSDRTQQTPQPRTLSPAAKKKPSENKPSENKPSENKPSENKPSETKPSETKPSETKPPDTRLPVAQCGVNRLGAARFKAALDAARAKTGDSPPSDRPGETRGPPEVIPPALALRVASAAPGVGPPPSRSGPAWSAGRRVLLRAATARSHPAPCHPSRRQAGAVCP